MIKATDEEILAEGIKLIEKAESRGVPVRLLGAVAIRLHCKEHVDLFACGESFLGRNAEVSAIAACLEFVCHRINPRELPW